MLRLIVASGWVFYLNDFHKFEVFFKKSAEETEFSLKYDETKDTSHGNLCTFMIYRRMYLRMTQVSDTICRETTGL
jgi:predicted RNA-binding protein (virulence factor B family)